LVTEPSFRFGVSTALFARSTPCTDPFLIRALSMGFRAMASARAATCSARLAQSTVFGLAPTTAGTNAIPAIADTTPTSWVRFLEGPSGMSPGLIGPGGAVLSRQPPERRPLVRLYQNGRGR